MKIRKAKKRSKPSVQNLSFQKGGERQEMKQNKNLPVKTYYYKDELTDEFSVSNIKTRKIDKDYVYIKKGFTARLGRFFAYRLIATPIAILYSKLVLGQRVKNKKVLRPFKKQGYFLFVNHTQQIGDAFLPNVALFPKSVYMIVHPDNVSQKVLGKITPYLGAIPTPTTISAMRGFKNAVEKRILEGNCVTVYPEAHIWPYYTKIRPFGDASFSYPIKQNTPVFCFTNTYQKKGKSEHPQIVTYIDGPFYPDKSLPLRKQRKFLRAEVYMAMCERAKKSNVEWIKYIPAQEKENN